MNAEKTNEQMEAIYRSTAVEDIPWHHEDPPDLLRDLVEGGQVVPGRALDIGCGTGSYSRYLATSGFRVTGVDVAETAIRIAEERKTAAGLDLEFRVADLTADVTGLGAPYDFINEWMILHHILPGDRKRYLANVRSLLAPGDRYLSVSFSLASAFGDPPTGRFRRSPLGPVVYCASLAELESFFSPHFLILDSRVTEIPGKKAPHTVNALFLQKR